MAHLRIVFFLALVFLTVYVILHNRQTEDTAMLFDIGSESVIINQQADAQVPRVYVPPPSANISKQGRRFTISNNVIKYMGLPPKQFFNLTPDTVSDFVFVTAAEQSHFEESKDAIASIQLHFPGYQIHYYDMGLYSHQRDEVALWCGVSVHTMDFSRFPAHITKNLKEKCWKYLVIQRALRDIHGAVFWVDASFRAAKPAAEWRAMFDMALNNGGMVLTNPAASNSISNYAYTDPAMYEFLPTNVERQKGISQICTCSAIIYNTEFVYKNILQWVYLCSLEAGCCELSRELRAQQAKFYANITAEQRVDPGVFRGKRYDQAIVNLLLTNVHGYDSSRYSTVNHDRLHNIMRYPTYLFNVTKC